MKKYLSLVLAFILVFQFAGVIPAKADDGGPNTAFWFIDHKTNCVSILNPEAVGSNAFLVFDYSARVGQSRGRPWAIVEKGKCYEVDDDTEDIYLIKIIKGNERAIFSDYNSYVPTDSIPHIFCKNDYDCNETKLGYSITPTDFLGETSASREVHFTGITANALFPTKYDFGVPITGFSSVTPEELKPILESSPFVSVSNLYTSLSKQLVSVLQSCDNRVRAERQYIVDTTTSDPFLYVKNILWKLGNNKDVMIQNFYSTLDGDESDTPKNLIEPDIFNEIDLMGCKAAFSAFIQEHQADFNTVDHLAQEVILKYPNALKKSDDDYIAPISLRSSTEISKILTFANNSNITSENNKDSIASKQKITPTVLDEPTSEKKIDILVNSSNPFMRLYVLLPALALIGILAFLVFRKK